MHKIVKMWIHSKAILALTKQYIGAFTSRQYIGASVEVGGGR